VTYAIDSEVRAALFDIDGTLTDGGNVWSVLLHSPWVSRAKKAWLYATALPHYGMSKVGFAQQADFRDRWVRLMAWLMGGWSVEQAQQMAQQTVQEILVPHLRPDALAIMAQHKAAGHPVILVSTMFVDVIAALQDYLGADAGLGSQVRYEAGRCLGQIAGETCSGERKVLFARDYLNAHFPDITLASCAAYADSRSDVPFLVSVGYPVAIYPDQVMRATALARGWTIIDRPLPG
jgi:HAD superfamily hydrolase (TIGR01490 family)